MKKKPIDEMLPEELSGFLREAGWEDYRARQIFSWLYGRGAAAFSSMSDLPRGLREFLESSFTVTALQVAEKLVSKKDGTVKLLLRTCDGNLIETVLMPSVKTATACVSVQAGCRFNCAFCASGKKGYMRDLSVAEITGQLAVLCRHAPGKKIARVVIMGTGEPLDNYENVLKAVRSINSPSGFGIGARRITVSTCGLIPGIKRLISEDLQVELSVSLHAADTKLRSELMPVNRKYPLDSLMQSCHEYTRQKGRQITFEYLVLEGINSSAGDARKLAGLLKGLKCHVNVIPYNEIPGAGFKSPCPETVKKFVKILEEKGKSVTIRRSRGSDISAACGQLRAGKRAP